MGRPLSDSADVVIVGAGKAGSQTALSLRAEGFEGSLTVLGDEDQLPYDRPPLSKEYLRGTYQDDDVLIRPRAFYEDNRIDLQLGTPVDRLDTVGRSVELRDGRTIGYGELVLATGSRARPLPVPGANLHGVLSLRSLDDARRLKNDLSVARSVVVIGGGFVGLEVAAAAARDLSCQVTIIEALPQLMSRTALPETAEHMTEYHTSLGSRVLLGTTVTALRGDARGHVTAVLTSDGHVFDADLVVFGIGAVPSIGPALNTGLDVRDGIRVDESLRASAAHVWAVGDCAAFPSQRDGEVIRLESVQNATDQARAVATSIASGRPVAYRAVPWFWSDQGDTHVQTVGLTGSHDLTAVVGTPADGSFSVLAFRGGAFLGADSVNARGDHLALRRLLARAADDGRPTLTPQLCRSAGFDLKLFARSVLTSGEQRAAD